MERLQAPLAAAPPRPRRRLGGRALVVGLLSLLTLGVFGGLRLLSAAAAGLPASLPQVSQQAAAAALPTPAPTALPAALGQAAGGNGALTVRPLQADQAGAATRNIYFILDASGSMLAKIDGQPKIAIARKAMSDLVNDLGASTNVALRTYGRNRPDDCSDIELVSPMAPLNREALLAQIGAIQPVNLSRTPIGSSLAAIPADLGASPGSTLVVLLSDGEESCDGDPVAEAARIHAASPNVQISVVGFDLAAPEQARLAAIAEAGGGSYFGAADVAQLGTALEQAIGLRYHVFADDGSEVGGAAVGETIALPVGSYKLTIGDRTVLLEQTIDVRDGLATIVTLGGDQGKLTAQISRDWAP
jgi:hypothetical protein